MTKRKAFGDIATVGEMRDILNEVIETHGEDVEVSVALRNGDSVWKYPPSPVFVPADEWDEYDDGALTIGEYDRK